MSGYSPYTLRNPYLRGFSTARPQDVDNCVFLSSHLFSPCLMIFFDFHESVSAFTALNPFIEFGNFKLPLFPDFLSGKSSLPFQIQLRRVTVLIPKYSAASSYAYPFVIHDFFHALTSHNFNLNTNSSILL